MMLRLLSYLVCAASLGVASAAYAEVKIGYVNTQRLLTESPQAQRISERLRKDFEKREQELQRKAKQLQTMQEQFQKEALTMSESERRNKEREIGEFSRNLQREEREFREDLSLRRNEGAATVLEAADKAVRKVAEAEKFTLIVQEAVYIDPRIDITDKVIRAMGDAAGK
ncbi:MAG: OmpH family outer membrane protein [Rhodocyclaceae bacterium]|nr:OmpH family outer membrane protein [Rhodocyclaceae bacterium]